MRSLREEQDWLITISVMAMAAVAVTAGLYYTRAVMIPFVLAIFVSYLVFPLVDVLELRLRLPRAVSLAITLMVVIAAITLLIVLVVMWTQSLIANAGVYYSRVGELLDRIVIALDRFAIDLGQDSFAETLKDLPVLNVVRSTLGGVVNTVSKGVLVLIIVTFLVAGRRRQRLGGAYEEIDRSIRRFISVKFATSAATGFLTFVMLSIIGLNFAPLFGFIAFCLNFIPTIGSIIAVFVPLPVAIAQFGSPGMVIAALALPGFWQMLIGNFLEPKFLGGGLKLHPVAIICALVFWGVVWGVAGMFLAAPMTAVFRIVMSKFETTRPVAELLAGNLPGVEGVEGA